MYAVKTSPRLHRTLLLSLEKDGVFPVLAMPPSQKWKEHVISSLTQHDGDALYLSFSLPASTLVKQLKQHATNILFVDMHEGGQHEENIICIDPAQGLTQVMIVVSRMLKMHRFKCTFLDAYPTVSAIYGEKNAFRFLSAIASLSLNHNTAFYFFHDEALENENTIVSSGPYLISNLRH